MVNKYFTLVLLLLVGCGGNNNNTTNSAANSQTVSNTIQVSSPTNASQKMVTFDNISTTPSGYAQRDFIEDDISLSLYDAYITTPNSTSDYVDPSTGGSSGKAIRFKINNNPIAININTPFTNLKEISFKACRYGESNQYRDYDAITNLALLKSGSADGTFTTISSFTLEYTVDNPGTVSFQVNDTGSFYYRLEAVTEATVSTRFIIDTMKFVS